MMSIPPNNLSNNAPYLRLQRLFPQSDLQSLTVEIDKAYIDIAQRVNDRMIGLFAVNVPSVTGERWFLQGSNARQQSLRQVYPITGAGSYPHGINFTSITAIVKIYGTIFDGTNYYPLPYVDVTNVTNQVSVQITPTNIVVTAGAGSPPSIVSGYVILEWLSQV